MASMRTSAPQHPSRELRVIHVTSGDDVRLRDYLQLTDMQRRVTTEITGGFFIAESFFVLNRVLDFDMSIRSILVEPKRLDRVIHALHGCQQNITIFTAEPEVLQSIVGYRVHRGVLASVARPAELSVREALDHSGDVALLEGFVEPTNVGLAFRSAAAMGFTSVVISPDCADPLYRRSVRTSMGAVLHMPWARSPSWESTLKEIQKDGIELIALTPDSRAQDLMDVLSHCVLGGGRVAAAFGSEGPGLTSKIIDRADHLARIPMDQGVDSLNVGATVAVVGFALRASREQR
jgi:tRNA G18 (ribose-2'-O)-methylase SpoU